jgi:hypothetical protein
MSVKQQAEHTVAISNLATEILRAQGFDRAGVCCGLAIMAKVIAGNDAMAKTALAETMAKLAVELDPDAISIKWQ